MLFVAVACTDEEPIVPPDIVPPVIEGEQNVVMKISFPNNESFKTKSPQTYALENIEENDVKTLDIFVLTSGGAGVSSNEDVYAYRVKIPQTKIKNDNVDGGTKTVTASLKVLSQKQRFIFVANMPSIALDLDSGITTQEDIIKQLKFEGDPWHTAQLTGSGNYTPIPMWGIKEDSVLINSSQSASLGTIHLIRSMAKINVEVAAGLTNFKLKNIYFYNVSDSGYIAPRTEELNSTVIYKTNPVDKNRRINITTPYAFPSTGSLLNTIYVPETDSLMVNGTDSIKPAYLVLEAELTKSSQTKTYYYRVDFSDKKDYYPLLRNHSYTIKIIAATEGFLDINDAIKAPVSKLNFALTLEDAQANINEVISNDQYMLGISVSEVLFDWDKKWVGQPSGGSMQFPLNIYTTYDGGWTAEISGGTWVAIDGASSGPKSESQTATLNLKITEDNRNGVERNALLTIRAGMLSKEIKIRQSGGANSYMAKFNSSATTASVNIPLSYANKARNGNLFTNIGINDLDVKVLWQETGSGQPIFNAVLETPGSSTEENHIKVTATSSTNNKYGNAVIAIVRKGSGIGMVGGRDNDKILWSWHVWTLPEAENMDDKFHNPNMPLFMKNSLGKYGDNSNKGLFYQWGRKDPFPANSLQVTPLDIVKRAVTSVNNLDSAINNPTTFYYQSGSINDWIGNTPNNDLWSSSGNKTYYDPCPTGWRIPSKDQVEKNWLFNSTQNHFNNGMISGVDGNYNTDYNSKNMLIWTLTTGSGNKKVYVSQNGSALGYDDANKTYGFSVRCVKDITLIKVQ